MSYKEKKRVFLELKDEKCVEADLDLLKSRYALCPRSYLMNPHRHADAILFTLLDVVPKEEILHHRAEFYRPTVAADAPEDDPEDKSEDEPKNEPKDEPKNEDNADKVETVETHEERADKAEKRAQKAEKIAEEAEKRAQEAEERADEEEERADDAEQARDEAEERATAAEEALEQEKKKD